MQEPEDADCAGIFTKLSSDLFAVDTGMSNVTIHVYAGTRHAFFDETVPTHYDAVAASLSWERTISFLRRHLAD